MTWLLAGVVAGISFAGTGLHSILDIHHGPGLVIPAQQTSVAGGVQAVAGDEGACDDANCPICNYLAQGSLVGERFEWFW